MCCSQFCCQTNLTLIWTIEEWQVTSSVWGKLVSLVGISDSSSCIKLMTVTVKVKGKMAKTSRRIGKESIDYRVHFDLKRRVTGGNIFAAEESRPDTSFVWQKRNKMRRSRAPSSLPAQKRARFQTPFLASSSRTDQSPYQNARVLAITHINTQYPHT